MEIKILGTGCPRCKKTLEIVTEVLEENKIDAKITKVENVNDIINYGIMLTPAIVINEKVKCSGVIPGKDDVLRLIKEEM
ncbi:MAG: thioredoxin family protein [Methanobacteriota archaeon]|nr:thioredoxin family protein [Candidatus Hydrothermarchaeota archaeon]